MTVQNPISRHSALRALSREHHQGLLLCWKIREGFRRNIAPERIKKYVEWFGEQYLFPHFDTEEKHLFPMLPTENELVRKALSQHRRLRRLFKEKKEINRSLHGIEEELEKHIRFEERVLFGEIEQSVDPDQWRVLEKHAPRLLRDDWQDQFWK